MSTGDASCGVTQSQANKALSGGASALDLCENDGCMYFVYSLGGDALQVIVMFHKHGGSMGPRDTVHVFHPIPHVGGHNGLWLYL